MTDAESSAGLAKDYCPFDLHILLLFSIKAAPGQKLLALDSGYFAASCTALKAAYGLAIEVPAKDWPLKVARAGS